MQDRPNADGSRASANCFSNEAMRLSRSAMVASAQSRSTHVLSKCFSNLRSRSLRSAMVKLVSFQTFCVSFHFLHLFDHLGITYD